MEIFTIDYEPLVARPKRIEITSSLRIPGIHIVGPTSKEKSDAQHRVRLAMENSGIRIPKRQITIQIPCTRLKKYLDGYDLAVCLALSSLAVPQSPQARVLAWGKVSILGRVESDGLTPKIRNILNSYSITHLLCSQTDAQNALLKNQSTTIIGIEHFAEAPKLPFFGDSPLCIAKKDAFA